MKIQRIRIEKGITQAELAEMCGTTQQQIAKIECGVVDPRLSTLRRIALALTCDIKDFFWDADEFLREIQAVVKESNVDPAKVGLLSINALCAEKKRIPSFEPLWERVAYKNKMFVMIERK